MNATDLIGCRRNPDYPAPTFSTILSEPLAHYQGWRNYVLPSTSQFGTGSCVVLASCCALEMKIRRDMGPEYIPYPMQLDPRDVFKHARAKYWPKELWDAGGLLLSQAYQSMIDMGWLPEDTEIVSVATMFAANEHMKDFPGIMGLGITDGWMGDRVSKRTGQIDESLSPAQSLAGHALTMVSFLELVEQQFLLFSNSGWARATTNWGRGGYGIATLPYIKEAMLDDFIFLDLKDGWKDHIANAMKTLPILTDNWGLDDSRLK